MLVRLLVLIALAFSLGEVRDADTVEQISFLEVEPEVGAELIAIEHSLAASPPRQLGMPPEHLAVAPLSMDAGRVFRPPRAGRPHPFTA
ncbi:MAG: hypothetical protein ACKV2T_41490 [Kofleriaceae bacterium]